MAELTLKKVKVIALFAFILALFAFLYANTIDTQESIFEIEVNNTNLAPSSSDSTGTGERVQGTTYYANETPIHIFVFSHGNQSGQNAEIHLSINGTKVLDVAGRPLGAAEQNNYSITAIIPQYASYMIEINNYHHYEWREYRVISGQNGSVNITNNYYSTLNETQLNTKVNKSGDTMTGTLNMSGSSIIRANTISNTTGYIEIYSSNSGSISGVNMDTISSNTTELYYNANTLSISSSGFSMDNDLDMQNNTILNANIQHKIRLITGNYTITENDETILSNSSNYTTITLPNATTDTNIYNIKNLAEDYQLMTGGTGSSGAAIGYIQSTKITANRTIEINRLIMNIATASGIGNMAIYLANANATQPTTLIANSSNQTLTSGINVFQISPTTVNNTESYFIAFQTQGASATSYYTNPGYTRCYRVYSYGDFPSTFSPSACDSVGYNLGYRANGVILISTNGELIDGSTSMQIEYLEKIRVQAYNSEWYTI